MAFFIAIPPQKNDDLKLDSNSVDLYGLKFLTGQSVGCVVMVFWQIHNAKKNLKTINDDFTCILLNDMDQRKQRQKLPVDVLESRQNKNLTVSNEWIISSSKTKIKHLLKQKLQKVFHCWLCDIYKFNL